MSSSVTIVADKYGNVINVCKNNEFGYIRVVQQVTILNRGFSNERQISALVVSKLEDLLQHKYQDGQELSGKIVIKESHQPFSEEDGDRDLKYAGRTGIPCHVDGEPIYRKTFYTDDLAEDHELIQHSNTDEIKQALQKLKEAGTPVKAPTWEAAGTTTFTF